MHNPARRRRSGRWPGSRRRSARRAGASGSGPGAGAPGGGAHPGGGRRGVRTRSVASSVSGSSKKSNSMSESRSVMAVARPGKLTAEGGVHSNPYLPAFSTGEGLVRAPANPGDSVSNAAPALVQSELVLGRYRPLRPLGERRFGLCLACPGRAERPGRRPQDRAPGGEGGVPRRARGRGRRPPAPPCLPARVWVRPRLPARLHRLRVRARGGPSARRSGAASSTTTPRSRPAPRSSRDSRTRTRRGIVHRDVKPSNVLLAEGKGISVRVLDFGLAQIQQAETLTAQGDVPGTLAYISPGNVLPGTRRRRTAA